MREPEQSDREERPAADADVPAGLPHLQLLPQEIPLDDPQSRYQFVPSAAKPFVATPAALRLFGIEVILTCLVQLQCKALLHQGLDYLQVFRDPGKPEELWFIEDGEGGAITALLPSDY